MNKKIKLLIILSILMGILWVSMVTTDYLLSVKAEAPVFAQRINASDADIYHGIGYTVIIDDGYAVSPPDAELKGCFHWGWR